MEKIAFILILACCFNSLTAQKMEIFTGVISSYGYKIINQRTAETSKQFLPNKQFVNIGYRVKFKLNTNFNFHYGLEFLQIGANKFDTTAIPDSIPEVFKIDRFVKFSQIRVPLKFGYKISDQINFELGYGFAYSFRKNQSFVYSYENNEAISYYNKFTHQLIIGLSYYWNKFNIRLDYNYSINPFYDTGKRYNFVESRDKYNREYGKLHFINLCFGVTLN